jgi:phosphohistidine swiveling domain-containing protein
MEPTYVIRDHDDRSDFGKPNEIGGKAANLFALKDTGFPVPPFFVVTADCFRKFIGADNRIVSLIQELSQQNKVPGLKGDEGLVAELQQAIIELKFDPELKQSLSNAFGELVTDGGRVAVRSSASDEDGADHSFAGMHDSFMDVPDFETVRSSIKQVWASAFNSRAIAYRIENSLDVGKIAVAVVIQKMIDARSSGVVFTTNPANERTDELVISSVWGAGEGLVSHGLAADTFTLKKNALNRATRAATGKETTSQLSIDQLDSVVVEKEHQLAFDSHTGSGLIEIPVANGERKKPSLTNQQLLEIGTTAIGIENFYRRPQDIEFCFDDRGELFILQARPITRIAEYGPAAGNRLTWDNANIVESYSGVTTPMTFSFIRRAYTIVYHCFAEVMGISEAKVHASRHVFENMLGLIRGRVYYNLQNWYRLIHLFPGFQYNAQFMESMMGLKEGLDLDDTEPPPSFYRKYFVELPALIRLVTRTLMNFLWIRSIVNEFQSRFGECYSRWDKMDFTEMAPHELKSLYHEMEDALLWNWKAPIINDFYVMIYFGLLKKLCATWANDQTGALQNDLICGEGGIESAEPAKMLLRMACDANKQPELRNAIFVDPVENVPDLIRNDDRFEAFNSQMARYLELYGFRCMNELKLEEFSLRDRPYVVYQVLRNYLSLADSSAIDVDAMNHREQQVRRDAEQRAYSEVGKGFHVLPRKWIFGRVLRNARLGVKNRENMRFARTRIYGVVRELIRALGQQLASEQIIEHREDIFYLTIDEVWDFIKGTAVTTSLGELASLRKSEFEAYRGLPDPDDRFETFGFVYHKNRFVNHNDDVVELAEGQLRGTGCCPGQLTHTVRVLRNPHGNLSLSGEILVAERTDPGWVPLYPAVSGILIERGSVLSHSAVVAREMGIPTIVGIKGLLNHVQDGDTVTMDGAAGIVTLHEDQNEST